MDNQDAFVEVSSYKSLARLTALAADTVTRCLIYEDYEECNFYRWDPVKIWQFEPPQPKKKGKKKANDVPAQLDDDICTHPPPPWKGLRVFRNWWWSNSYLGPVNSPLRCYILSALEHRSWTSSSEEEDILFLLLRLCLDTQINIGSDTVKEIPRAWSFELVSILEQLAPFPLQKLIVTKDIFLNKTVIATILQGSPQLQILRIGQWEVNNDILLTLGTHCKQLQEFSIPCMKPDVFMSDTAIFRCFFGGMSAKDVMLCFAHRSTPKISFKNLKYVDILYCKQMQRFLQMLCLFYPKVCISGIDLSVRNGCHKLLMSYIEIGANINTVALGARTNTILNEKLDSLVKSTPYLRELRLHVDDNFPGADSDSMYRRKLEEAADKLKSLIGTTKSLDSLVLRPHEGTDITSVVLPAIAEYGKCLRSLHLIYDFSGVNTNSLYQLLNQCTQLKRLIVALNVQEVDNAAKSFRTKLRTCFCLNTFLLVHVLNDEVDNEDLNDLAVVTIVSDVLNASPNLQTFGLSCRESVHMYYYSFFSVSVIRLHLQFASAEEVLQDDDDNDKSITYSYFFLNEFLRRFPNLKTLSVEDPESKLWFEGLLDLTKRGFSLTRKTPEFFNYFKWEDSDNSDLGKSVNMAVM